jgi:hypothetical protein
MMAATRTLPLFAIGIGLVAAQSAPNGLPQILFFGSRFLALS